MHIKRILKYLSIASCFGSLACQVTQSSSNVSADLDGVGFRSDSVEGDEVFTIVSGPLEGLQLTKVNPLEGVGNQPFSDGVHLCENLTYGSESDWKILEIEKAYQLKNYRLGLNASFQIASWVGRRGNKLKESKEALEKRLKHLCRWKHHIKKHCVSDLPDACSGYSPVDLPGTRLSTGCRSYLIFLRGHHDMAPQSYPDPDTIDDDLEKVISQIASLNQKIEDETLLRDADYLGVEGTYNFVTKNLSDERPQLAGVVCTK